MSDERCEYSEDAAGWVLGALSDQEAERFAAHLRDCPRCRAEVARLTEATELLLEGVPLVTPRPELRQRLLAAVQAQTSLSAAASGEPSSVAATQKGTRSLLRTGLLLLIAAGVIAVIGVLVWGGSGHPSNTRTVVGHVTTQGGAPRAHATVSIRAHQATLVIVDLAAPPPGRVYQAWVMPPGSPALPTGALFSAPPSRETRIVLPPLHGMTQVIVTAEPPTGSQTPTLPAIVVVNL